MYLQKCGFLRLILPHLKMNFNNQTYMLKSGFSVSKKFLRRTHTFYFTFNCHNLVKLRERQELIKSKQFLINPFFCDNLQPSALAS